jgi:hypothetical protein
MPIHFDRVQPGGLITAAFLNSILDEIEHLQDEVDTITGGQPEAPVITALIPGGAIPELSVLQILGHNFATPATLNTVTLDSVLLTGFQPGSSDSVLRVTVPSGIQGLPKTMTLTVATAKGAAAVNVQVVPAAPSVAGQPVITNATSGQPAIAVGQTYTLTFLLDGTALTAAEQFNLSVLYTNANPPLEAQWQAATTIVGPVQNQVTLAPGERRTVDVRLTVPAGANSVAVSLLATSVHNSPGSDAKSLPISITVGQPPPNNDAGVTMHIGPFGSAAPMRVADIDGAQGLLVRYATQVQVPIVADFTDTGTYAFSVSVDSAAGVWTVTQPLGQPVGGAAGGETTIFFKLQLIPASFSNEKRTLTVTATRQDGGAAGHTSSVSFPIAGES